MLNAELKILGGKYQGKSIPLTTKRFLVGREQDCQLRPNSELVSRHHCVFVIDDYSVRLRDLGSTNGTRVNGDLVRGEIVLKPGDRVTIGRLEVELVVQTPAEVTAQVSASGTENAAPDVRSLSNTATMELPAFDVPVESAPTTTSQAAETNFEIPPLQSQMPTVANLTGDTAIIPGGAGAPMAPLQAYPQMQPQMGYPMGYPYQMPVYPQPMPGYGYGMPGGYPMAMPMMPQYPGMPQHAPAMTGSPAPGDNKMAEMPVRLPDPTSTGVRAAPTPAPVPAAAPGQPSAAPPTEIPSESAADIIKNYMQRRVSH